MGRQEAPESASSVLLRIHTFSFRNDVFTLIFPSLCCHGFDFNFILITEIKDVSPSSALARVVFKEIL